VIVPPSLVLWVCVARRTAIGWEAALGRLRPLAILSELERTHALRRRGFAGVVFAHDFSRADRHSMIFRDNPAAPANPPPE